MNLKPYSLESDWPPLRPLKSGNVKGWYVRGYRPETHIRQGFHRSLGNIQVTILLYRLTKNSLLRTMFTSSCSHGSLGYFHVYSFDDLDGSPTFLLCHEPKTSLLRIRTTSSLTFGNRLWEGLRAPTCDAHIWQSFHISWGFFFASLMTLVEVRSFILYQELKPRSSETDWLPFLLSQLMWAVKASENADQQLHGRHTSAVVSREYFTTMCSPRSPSLIDRVRGTPNPPDGETRCFLLFNQHFIPFLRGATAANDEGDAD